MVLVVLVARDKVKNAITTVLIANVWAWCEQFYSHLAVGVGLRWDQKSAS